MDIHRLAAGGVGLVNPYQLGTIQVSIGSTINADGSAQPGYRTVPQVPMQIQELSFEDLRRLDGLNLQGVRRAIYVRGRIDGIVRPLNKGGDLINLADGSIWLVAHVIEAWDDWCKLAVTLQDGS